MFRRPIYSQSKNIHCRRVKWRSTSSSLWRSVQRWLWAPMSSCSAGPARRPRNRVRARRPRPKSALSWRSAAEIPLPSEYAGRVVGVRDVEVRSQVGGLLLKQEYEDGVKVEKDQVLFRIDPATYQVALSRAEAQLQQAQATLRQADENFERTDDLFRRGVSTDKLRDEALAARDQARASVQPRRGGDRERKAQPRLYRHQCTGDRRDGTSIAVHRHAYPAAADPAHHHHPARSRLCELLVHRRGRPSIPCHERAAPEADHGRRPDGGPAIRRRVGLSRNPARSIPPPSGSIRRPGPSRRARSSPTRRRSPSWPVRPGAHPRRHAAGRHRHPASRQ